MPVGSLDVASCGAGLGFGEHAPQEVKHRQDADRELHDFGQFASMPAATATLTCVLVMSGDVIFDSAHAMACVA